MVEFVAVAVGHRVVGDGVVVHELFAADGVEAVHHAIHALTGHDEVDVVPRQPRAGADAVREEPAVARHPMLNRIIVERPANGGRVVDIHHCAADLPRPAGQDDSRPPLPGGRRRRPGKASTWRKKRDS